MKIAIYSRKSIFTGKGESIENQIELCKEYCTRNYQNENIDYIVYEDEGFSGSNTNRPEFQQLLKDAQSKKFDALICYRLDRISRNVADFSATLSILQNNDIDFISINEKFDTSTPMGRAMVYISSVFAQLERETIAERVRDNMLQLAKTGRWLGGQIPTGFNSEKISYLDEDFKERSLMKLAPNDEELEMVKLIYKTYLKEQSIRAVVKKLSLSGIKGKNDGRLSSSQFARILRNPIYVKSSSETHNYLKEKGINVFGEPNGNGYLTYNKTKQAKTDRDLTEWVAAVAKHKGIINSDDWLQVQDLVEKNKSKKFIRVGTGESNNAILSGILKCSVCGANLLPRQSSNNHYYYICSNKINKYTDRCTSKNIRVERLDNIIIDKIKLYNKEILISTLEKTISPKDIIGNFEDKQKEKLAKEIEEKTFERDNLRKRIPKAKDEETAEMLMEDLKTINDELKELQSSYKNIGNAEQKLNAGIKEIKTVIKSLEYFNKNIEITENILQKRFLLQSVVEKIIWNGDTYDAKIELLGFGDIDEELKKK